MGNLSRETSRTQADASFGAEVSEVQIAVEATREHDSTQPVDVNGTPYFHCAACGKPEEADVDSNYEGTHAVASRPSSLVPCSSCNDCATHVECRRTVGETSGLCPCCAWIANEKRYAALRREYELEAASVHAEQEVSRLCKMADAETDEEKKSAALVSLRRIGEAALVGYVNGRNALLRARLTALPLGDVA